MEMETEISTRGLVTRRVWKSARLQQNAGPRQGFLMHGSYRSSSTCLEEWGAGVLCGFQRDTPFERFLVLRNFCALLQFLQGHVQIIFKGKVKISTPCWHTWHFHIRGRCRGIFYHCRLIWLHAKRIISVRLTSWWPVKVKGFKG